VANSSKSPHSWMGGCETGRLLMWSPYANGNRLGGANGNRPNGNFSL
jgi:hypothetical protein